MARPKKNVIAPDALKTAVVTPKPNAPNEWVFKITGRGTSGWMSWVWEDHSWQGCVCPGLWVKLRPSETSFISVVAAIEPEVMRLAFPHTVTKRKK